MVHHNHTIPWHEDSIKWRGIVEEGMEENRVNRIFWDRRRDVALDKSKLLKNKAKIVHMLN
jgi:hypothetical protein